jgi:hypothetical protein
MWIKLLTLAILGSVIVLLSLSLHKLNSGSNLVKSKGPEMGTKLCGSTYVDKQNACLNSSGNCYPGLTADGFAINSWADKAQACMNKTMCDCKAAGCRPEDCPRYRRAYRDYGL